MLTTRELSIGLSFIGIFYAFTFVPPPWAWGQTNDGIHSPALRQRQFSDDEQRFAEKRSNDSMHFVAKEPFGSGLWLVEFEGHRWLLFKNSEDVEVWPVPAEDE